MRPLLSGKAARVAPAVAVAAVAAGWTVLGLLRLGLGHAADSLWAEDASIFLEQSRTHGLAALWEPYNGYLHTVPRLLSIPLAVLPLEWVPAYASVVSVLGLTACSLAILASDSASAGRRLFLGTALVLFPVYGGEVLGNLTYLQWPLLCASFWLCTGRPRAWHAVPVALALLSTPLALLLLPAIAVNARLHGVLPRRLAWAAVAAAAVQGLVVLTQDRVHDGAGGAWAQSLWVLLAQRVLGPLVLGDVLNKDAWLFHPALHSFVVTAALAGLACLALPAVRAAAPQRAQFLLLAGGAAALFAAAVALAEPPLKAGDLDGWGGARYFVAPAFLLAAAAVAAHPLLPAPKAAAAALALVFLVAAATSFTVPGAHRADTWGEEVGSAREACRADPGSNATIRISPPGWAWRPHCRVLAGPG